ncbi:MAG: hypothetical protein Ct9H300mP32_2530 [Verrucomicrobiota bacterium]|nr:MAG: hypothetical protein Ct9H300mP32_2530 [Verrucomicrobiota bacterium]
MFRSLGREELTQILDLELAKVQKRLAHEYSLRTGRSRSYPLLEKGPDPTYGARPMRRAVEKYLEDPMAEEIIRGDLREGEKTHLRQNDNWSSPKKRPRTKTQSLGLIHPCPLAQAAGGLVLATGRGVWVQVCDCSWAVPLKTHSRMLLPVLVVSPPFLDTMRAIFAKRFRSATWWTLHFIGVKSHRWSCSPGAFTGMVCAPSFNPVSQGEDGQRRDVVVSVAMARELVRC